MTLLKGNELNSAKSKKIDLVLRKKSGERKFAELLLGTEETLTEYKAEIWELLSEDLQQSLIPTQE